MSNQTTTTTQQPTFNGVGVDKVMDVITSIEQDADNSSFQFRLNNRWIDGGLNRSRVQGFFAVGREDEARTQPFVFDADEPGITGGGDTAPNPMEFVLHSLASCMTSTLVYHAAVQGIAIQSVDSSLEGDLDVRGMLGMSDQVLKRYNQVRVRMRVQSAASEEVLKELAMFSPVFDMVSKSLPVEFILEKI